MPRSNRNPCHSGRSASFISHLAIWLAASCVATATDRYVAPNGVNSTTCGSGLSVGSPYLTIDYVANHPLLHHRRTTKFFHST